MPPTSGAKSAWRRIIPSSRVNQLAVRFRCWRAARCRPSASPFSMRSHSATVALNSSADWWHAASINELSTAAAGRFSHDTPVANAVA